MCTFGVLGLSCETPAAPRTPNVQFEYPGASNTTKFPREDPQREREKERKWGREMEKKSAKFWPPTLRAPTLRAPTLRAPTLGTPTLRPPFFRAEALRASTFSGFGPLRSSFLSCCSFVLFLCIFNCFFFLVIFFYFFLKKNFSFFQVGEEGRGGQTQTQTSFKFGREEAPPPLETGVGGSMLPRVRVGWPGAIFLHRA